MQRNTKQNPLQLQKTISKIEKAQGALLASTTTILALIKSNTLSQKTINSEEVNKIIQTVNESSITLNTHTVSVEGAQTTASTAILGLLALSEQMVDIRTEMKEIRARLTYIESQLHKDTRTSDGSDAAI